VGLSWILHSNNTPRPPERLYRVSAFRSFKVIQICTNRTFICHCLLVFNYNYEPILCRFRGITIYWQRDCVFRRFYPPQCHLKPLKGVFPCDLGYEIWSGKSPRWWKPNDPAVLLIGYDGLRACDKTDVRTDTPLIGQWRACIADDVDESGNTGWLLAAAAAAAGSSV